MSVHSEAGFFYGEMILDATTAQGIPLPTTPMAVKAFFSIETANVRYRYDGGEPTADTGHGVLAGSSFVIEGPQNVKNLKLIAQTGNPMIRYTLEKA